MPIQIWSNPNLAAEIQTQAGRDLGQYIAGTGAQVGHDLGDVLEYHNNLGKQAKAFESLLSTLPEDERPMPIEQFRNLSAKDKVSSGKGFIEAQGYRRAQEEMQNMRARRDALDRAAANDARLPQFMSSLGELSQARPRLPVGELPPDAYAAPNTAGMVPDFSAMAESTPGLRGLPLLGEASKRSGYRPDLRGTIDDIIRGAGDSAGPPIIDQVDLPFGNKGVSQRGSKQLQILNDPKAALTSEEVEDADGNMHTLVRNPKTGALTLLRPPSAQKDPNQITANEKLRALNLQMEALMKFPSPENRAAAAAISKRIDTLMEGGNAATPATDTAPPAAQPLPKSKTELKKGQTYQTARGAAVWDGEKFTQ